MWDAVPISKSILLVTILLLSVFSGPLPALSETTSSTSGVSDIYEEDDLLADAGIIVINDQQLQLRTIHDAGDADWVKFFGLADEMYAFRVEVDNYPEASKMYASFKIYTAAGDELGSRNTGAATPPPDSLTFEWSCPENGIYYLKISNFSAEDFGPSCNYKFSAFHPYLSDFIEFTSVTGAITAGTIPLEDAVISAIGLNTGTGLTSQTGDYIMELPDGIYDFTVEATGYDPKTFNGVELGPDSTTTFFLDITGQQSLSGDLNGSGQVDLVDEIIALQTMAGMEPAVPFVLANSVGDTSTVGLADAIFILQGMANLP